MAKVKDEQFNNNLYITHSDITSSVTLCIIRQDEYRRVRMTVNR